MCDYSLELYRAVPAAAGEQYTQRTCRGDPSTLSFRTTEPFID